jgi:hypothetical protein
MHIRHGIVIFLTCFFCFSTYGSDSKIYTFQDHHRVFGKNNISLSLVPVLTNGFEINYDRRIVERHWIKIAPMYLRSENYRQTHLSDMRRAAGYGFKLQHKYFPYANTEKKYGLFLSYGPTFQRFDTETHARENLSFNKFGFECVIGGRKVLYNVFYVEFYGGLISNYLKIQKDETENWRKTLKSHSTMWFDYGKTGNFMIFGINIGVLF